MQGYDFIDQSSMRAAPGEAERPGGGRCEAHWWPWGGRRGEDLFALRLLYEEALSVDLRRKRSRASQPPRAGARV